MHHEINERIRQEIGQNDIVLYMKGTAAFPQCGFSAALAEVLNGLGIEYKDINVLSSPGLLQGIKEFSNWPSTPQLYIKGEFVGGCDIVREMATTGELQELLAKKGLLPR